MACLSQSTGYAVQALGAVAAADRPLLVRAIAERCRLPAPYLSKVIHRLARSGLVITRRGVAGGVTIARDARSLTLLDVCTAMGDPILEDRCVLGLAHCERGETCPAHPFAVESRRRTLEFLADTTIADLADFERARTPRPFSTPAPPSTDPRGPAAHPTRPRRAIIDR